MLEHLLKARPPKPTIADWQPIDEAATHDRNGSANRVLAQWETYMDGWVDVVYWHQDQYWCSNGLTLACGEQWMRAHQPTRYCPLPVAMVSTPREIVEGEDD